MKSSLMRSSFLHYEVIEKLGEGGMGLVYLANDTKLKRKVALKFLPRHISADPTERQRFRLEAQAVASLSHPNIAQVYAIEELDDALFIVMEYIKGKELKEVIEDGELTIEQKWLLAEQIAAGIKVAHDSGVIHRDIKSRNIMIDQSGSARIMDFGLARVQGTDHITKTGTTLGTTAYMAPELLAGQEVDIRSDIWAFGVVLFELFTGELPFQGIYEPAVMYAIVEEEPLLASELVATVPKQIEYVIEKCLQKDRDQRYQEFSEVITDLTKSNIPTVRRSVDTKKSRLAASTYALVGVPAALVLIVLIVILQMNLIWFGDGIPDRKYLAVLPVENLSMNPDLQAISAGLAETFSYKLSELEKYEDFYWVAPAGEMRKEKVNSVSQANKLFGVNLAILSSIQTVQDSTRLIIELVDAENIRRLGTEQVVVASNDLALLERNGVKAMLQMLNIEIDSRIEKTLKQGEPSNPEAYEYYLIGLAGLQNYSTSDSLDMAIHYFSQAVEMDSDFVLAHIGLGESYWRKYESTREANYVEEAEKALNIAMEIHQDLAPVQTLMGMLKAGTGQHDAAVQHYSKALDIDPNYSAAYRGLAKVYDEQGDTEKAVNTYVKAIYLKPNYWEGYKDLGAHHLRKGNIEAAIEQFDKVVQLLPRNSTAYSNLGVAYYYNGDTGKARQMFEKSLALEKNPVTANNLAGIYYWEGKYGESAAMYEIALEANFHRYEIWGNLAAAYDLNGQKEKARKSYLTAIEKAKEQLDINPNNPEVMADLGAYYSDVGDTSRALSYIRQATALSADNILIKQRAVATYEKLGMRQDALKWIEASMISDIESQPEFRALISDPGYLELKKKLLKDQQINK